VPDLPTRHRVVEVIAYLGAGASPRWQTGSGFLVGEDGTVLTAAHVVVGAVSVSVREVDKTEHAAALDPAFVGDVERCDLALLTVPELAGRAGSVPVAAVDPNAMGWQFIDQAWSVGYPRFNQVKRRPEEAPLRETAHVHGRIPPLNNAAEGRCRGLRETVPARRRQ
jgi:Trypsin-like peptidase domain